MPNPLPNELLLMFSGYLSFKGLIYFPFVILTAIAADVTGTSILYFLFYNAGAFIMQKKPRWFPLSAGMINNLTVKISRGGKFNIYLFRLTPFTRGYASVITGLLHIRPKIFLPIAFISALTWSLIYVSTGYLIGPSWNLFTQNLGIFKYIMLGFLVLILFLVLFLNYKRQRENYNDQY